MPLPTKGARMATAAETSLVTLGLSVAIFLFYFAAYPIRHLKLPMGFDPPYYVWRAQYLASQGIGAGGTAARPGPTIPSGIFARPTRRAPPQLAGGAAPPLVAPPPP